MIDLDDFNKDFFQTDTDSLASVAYLDPTGLNKEIAVIYDREYALVEIADGVEVENYRPVMWVQTSQIPEVVKNMQVKIDTTTYKIRDIQPDGKGVTLLILYLG